MKLSSLFAIIQVLVALLLVYLSMPLLMRHIDARFRITAPKFFGDLDFTEFIFLFGIILWNCFGI